MRRARSGEVWSTLLALYMMCSGVALTQRELKIIWEFTQRRFVGNRVLFAAINFRAQNSDIGEITIAMGKIEPVTDDKLIGHFETDIIDFYIR